MRRSITTVLAIVLLCSGCGVKHIRALSDAETVFNRASEADNRARFGTQTGIVTSASIVADYRLAAKMLDDLIAKQGAQLKTDKLFCTAVALQGLSRWRVGDHAAAMSAFQNGQECIQPQAVQAAPRDAALIRALPGLIRIDQAKAMVDNGKTGDEDAIHQLIHDAHADLSAAAGLVPSDSPVREYLVISHLAAVRVLQESIKSENLTGNKLDAVNREYWESGRCWLTRYRLMEGAEGIDYKERAEAWNRLLGSLGYLDNQALPACPQ